MARIRDIKILKKNPLHQEICINLLLNTREGSLTLEVGET